MWIRANCWLASHGWPVTELAKTLQRALEMRFHKEGTGFDLPQGAVDGVGTLFKTDIFFSFHSTWSFSKGTILQGKAVKNRSHIVTVMGDDIARTC